MLRSLEKRQGSRKPERVEAGQKGKSLRGKNPRRGTGLAGARKRAGVRSQRKLPRSEKPRNPEKGYGGQESLQWQVPPGSMEPPKGRQNLAKVAVRIPGRDTRWTEKRQHPEQSSATGFNSMKGHQGREDTWWSRIKREPASPPGTERQERRREAQAGYPVGTLKERLTVREQRETEMFPPLGGVGRP
jgi:hypothetical protein